MNEQDMAPTIDLFITPAMLDDIGYFLNRFRDTNADAVTFAYPNGEFLNIQIKESEIKMIIYK